MKRTSLAGGILAAGLVAAAAGSATPAFADGHAPLAPRTAATSKATPGTTTSVPGSPDKAVVKHKAWQQKKGSWCVPASVQLSLRTFGVKVTQDSLAKQMKTDSHGTSGNNALPVYKKYLATKGYTAWLHAAPTAQELMDLASYDVGVLHKAVPVGIVVQDAPWAHTNAKSKVYHAVSLRGYDRTKGTVTIWDPSKSSYGGHHTVPVKDLAKAAHDNTTYVVDKKK